MGQKKRPVDLSALSERLGRAIAERRKAKKMTQDDLAGMVEVDPVTISRFERGTNVPSLERLALIAWALDLGVGELFAAASPLTNDRARTVLSAMEILETGDQQLVVDFAHFLMKR